MGIYTDLISKQKSISVTGLGYVGLPVALAFAKHFRVIAFDMSEERIGMMREGIDPSRELEKEAFEGTDIAFTADPGDLEQAHFHIVCVPTDIDKHKVPDLNPILTASQNIGKALKKGDYVVYESTVYPGCTEEDCLPILEESGLKVNTDFKLGYSPERINPGDVEHTLTRILKVVSGSDEEALEEIARVYGHIIEAGIHKAPSIKVAEAAKVIENTQRDINIAFMNELSIIFDRMDIDTQEVLEAAGTKWNFMPFRPGLVGGHCIGVDPYYLAYKAEQLGFTPEMILSGRRLNDGMPGIVAKKLVQALIRAGKNPRESKVLVMGMTFKENVADIRNSRVVDLVRELMSFSINVHVTDPYANPNEVAHEYGVAMIEKPVGTYDGIVVAVGHKEYCDLNGSYFDNLSNGEPIVFDIKGIFSPESFGGKVYWKL